MTLATTLGARATPPSQVQSTLTAIADTATQTLAADTSVLYPGVSSADLYVRARAVRTAAASGRHITCRHSASILTAAERLAQIMRAGGVDITRAPVEPSTGVLWRLLLPRTDQRSVDPQKMIDEGRKPPHRMRRMCCAAALRQKDAGTHCVGDSRTPSILRLIGPAGARSVCRPCAMGEYEEQIQRHSPPMPPSGRSADPC